MSHVIFQEANLCCPCGYEGLDPLQVHLDGLWIRYLLASTQFEDHLQQMVSPQGKHNRQDGTWKCYSLTAGSEDPVAENENV